MARRIPLPRLTQRQRMARWQRERRQRALIITIFSAVLFFVLGLAAWAASDRYYTANLTPALTIDGQSFPMRDYNKELAYQLAHFYVSYGVPPGYENDSRIAQQKKSYETTALEALVQHWILDKNAKADGITVTPQQIDERYVADYGEYHARHILITPSGNDPAVADANALAKATAIADQLRQDPMNQTLWNELAAQNSDDPGSKNSGGDLGFVGKGQFVKQFEDAVKTLQIGQISDPVKSSYGYHVIQVLELRKPADSQFVQRAKSYGFTEQDVKQHVRYDILKDDYTARVKDQNTHSPTAQVHLAWIAVAAPKVTGGNFQSFTDQVKKVDAIQAAIDSGTDFAAIVKQYSEDSATVNKGGDLGWYARGMITKLDIENDVFSLPVGKVSSQKSDASQTVWYKVLEKDPSRPLDDAQKKQIENNAYDYWYQHQKKMHQIQKLVPGHELDG